MNLPNYFLADLPPEATLTAAMVQEACQTLKRNRERYLVQRSTQSIVSALCAIARSWSQADYPFRKLALEQGPGATGFSSATLAAGLDSFFGQLTPEGFQTLLDQDLGHGHRLDHFAASDPEQKTGRASLAIGPELLVHITAGNLPTPALMSIVLGFLVRSAQFVKCAQGTSFIPRLLAHSIYEAEPKLGACLEIVEWRGGQADLETALFSEADCLTATGSDETLAEIRRRLPHRLRLLGYGQRVSFAYVAAEILSGFTAKRIAARAATDVAAWNQLGCLSPHVIYVQAGGTVSPEKFAELLAEALFDLEQTAPRGEVPPETAASIASRRSIYEVRAAHSPDTRQWASKQSTAWTVVYETDPRFQLSCLHRFVYVKPVKDLAEALQNADNFRRHVSSVGLAVPEHKTQEHAVELARWGAARVCPIGQMQNPALPWRHDGRPALGDLVSWTDWEVE